MLYQISNGAVAFGDDVILHSIDFEIRNTEKIAIVGRNGCGKTTLMKLITGVTKPDSGTIEIGDTIRIGYFSQENEALDPNMKVLDYVKETAEYIQTTEGLMSASTMCERFLFGSYDQQKPSLVGVAVFVFQLHNTNRNGIPPDVESKYPVHVCHPLSGL